MLNNDNYFSLFQLPMALPVDLTKLNGQYQQLQREYHPDNHATAADSEKTAALQKSATINTAYRTLKDPIAAAEYRLSLQGIDINSEHHTISEPLFLGEQFELRETLDEIEQAKDWPTLDRFYREVSARKQQIYDDLLLLIEQGEWQKAKTILYQLRYFARLIEQIELLQDQQFEL